MFHLWPARSSLCNHHLLGGDPPAGREARLPATLQLIELVQKAMNTAPSGSVFLISSPHATLSVPI